MSYKLTENLTVSEEVKYLIFVDNIILGLVSTLKEAKDTIAELTHEHINLLKSENKSTNVFRQDHESSIQIFVQTIGSLFNGPVTMDKTFSFKTVPLISK